MWKMPEMAATVRGYDVKMSLEEFKAKRCVGGPSPIDGSTMWARWKRPGNGAPSTIRGALIEGHTHWPEGKVLTFGLAHRSLEHVGQYGPAVRPCHRPGQHHLGPLVPPRGHPRGHGRAAEHRLGDLPT